MIQKGDRVTPVHEKVRQRLLEDWMQWAGKRPNSRFVAELKPLLPDDQTAEISAADAGPGVRQQGCQRRVEVGRPASAG